MQLRDLLKDIFTDLKQSCIKCGLNNIYKTCQIGNPGLINEMVLQSFGFFNQESETLKIEGYSTQLEALCQRIDMIELEMENLKSHHLNVVQCQSKCQGMKDTHDKATMTFPALTSSKSQVFKDSVNKGSSTSPDTRVGYDLKPQTSFQERVRQELNSIYEESMSSPAVVTPEEGIKQIYETRSRLYMVQKRSQPQSKVVKKDSGIKVFPKSPKSLNVPGFNHSHGLNSSRDDLKSENQGHLNQSGFKSSIEMQIIPPTLISNESLISEQKKDLSHTQIDILKSNDSKYTFETFSVQNINLDFNLVEDYEENRSDNEFQDQVNSLNEFHSAKEDFAAAEFLKIHQIQSQNDYSPEKNDYFSDHKFENPVHPYEQLSHRDKIYSNNMGDLHSTYQYTGDYQNGKLESRYQFRKNSHETNDHPLNNRLHHYFSANSPQGTPSRYENFGVAASGQDQDPFNTDATSPYFNQNQESMPFKSSSCIQRNLFGKLSGEKNLNDYIYQKENQGLYGRPRAYSSPQSIKQNFDHQTKVGSYEGRSSILSGSQENQGRSSAGLLIQEHYPIQIIQEEQSNNEPDAIDSQILDSKDNIVILVDEDSQKSHEFQAPLARMKSTNQLYVSKSPQIKAMGGQTRIMNLNNLIPLNFQVSQYPQIFGRQQPLHFGPQQLFQSSFQKPTSINFNTLHQNYSPCFQREDIYRDNMVDSLNQSNGKKQLSILDSNGQIQMFQPTRPSASQQSMLNGIGSGLMAANSLMRSTTIQMNETNENDLSKAKTTDYTKEDETHKKGSKVEIDLNTKPVVNFIRIEKHQPTRKNIHEQIIFWNEESTDDYKFSQYLEQNRYQRLFKEISMIGEGGFGKVYKAQHVLDQRIYAIKKIQIHLGVNQDFKMHHVYKEIVAISQVLHKNVVRYYACWIESVSANEKNIQRVCKRLEFEMKKNFRKQKPDKLKITEDMLDMNKPLMSPKKLTASRKMSFKASIDAEMIEDKWRGKNLLKIIEDDGEVLMEEEWDYQKKELEEKSDNSKTSKSMVSYSAQSSSEQDSSSSDSSSSQDSSSESSSSESDDESQTQERSFMCTSKSKTKSKLRESSEESFSSIEEEESSDDFNSSQRSHASLYELIEKEKNFITLNVMIQMEVCSGQTLREFMDTKDYTVNRKVNYHYFKQLISGLQHIHEEGLIHRDIKPANIFIDKARMSLKIGDFGLAKQNNVQQELSQEIQGLKRQQWSLADLKQYNSITTLQSKDHLERKQLKAQMVNGNQVSAEVRRRNIMTSGRNNEDSSIAGDEELEASICAGTPMYQSPEQTMQQIQIKKNNNEAICLTDKVDMFAAGLILYEMCSSFKTAHQRIQNFSKLRNERVIDEEKFKNMPEERDIILNLTDPDPKKRSSAIYLLKSKTFQAWSFESKQ